MPSFATGSGGVRLAWEQEGTGTPVLLVHGIGFKRKRWDAQVRALVDAGFRVVRFDLRGFGDSDAPADPYGRDEFMEDLRAVVDVVGLERFHLVGHSLGGMLGMKLAVENPEAVKSLTVVSGTSHNGRRATAFARVMVLYSERGFEAVMNDDAARPGVEEALREAFPGIDPPLEMLRAGLAKPNLARAGAWRACIDYTVKDRLAELKCPVFVTHGSADPMIPFKNGQLIHEAIAHSEWKEETGAGHSLPTERRESFNAALIDFLARVERG